MALSRPAIQTLAVCVCAAPAAAVAAQAATTGLGANPIEALTHVTGEWALRFLLVSLAVTPARRWLGFTWVAPLRRTFGLAAFAYASLHLATYVGLDQFFDLEAIVEDVLDRRYITVGMAGFLCLLPLALTSTRGAIKRLGQRWITLHRLAYVAGVCGVVHYLWLVKADLLAPIVHAAILVTLLLSRWLRPRRSATPGRS